MPPSTYPFPDIDGLDALFGDSDLAMQVSIAALLLTFAFVVAHAVVDRIERRSPVERLIKGRGR